MIPFIGAVQSKEVYRDGTMSGCAVRDVDASIWWAATAKYQILGG